MTAAWLTVPLAYLLGGVSPGYWLVRWKTGADVRQIGSGATGATNAARALGRGAFAAVLALDAAKGALAALGARFAGLEGGWEFFAAAAVVAGHVWPVQLGFRGGRGLGPLLGAWLALAPLAIGACLIIAGVSWAISRRRVAAGLFGTLLLPATTWFEVPAPPAVAGTVAAAIVVLVAHRLHWRPGATASTDRPPPPRSLPCHEPPQAGCSHQARD